MPELPEVETSRRGIEPYLLGHGIEAIQVRQPQLRWPVPAELQQAIGATIHQVKRRAKYLLVESTHGTIILHLGMSGSLRVVDAQQKAQKHDHIDIVLSSGRALRLHDPRRFGAVLWTTENPLEHKLLSKLGPEPLDDEFNAEMLYGLSRGRKVAVKQFIMNAHVVVGVGNIYASESLFMAHISPKVAAGRISLTRYERLVEAIKHVLTRAIQQGGTTLRDFVQAEGKPGYFQQELNVYGKASEACRSCGTQIKQITQGQRSTFYCPSCQR